MKALSRAPRLGSACLVLLGTLAQLGCGGGDATPDAAATPTADAFVAETLDAFAPSPDVFVHGLDANHDGAVPAGAGSIEGVVTRSAMPAAGGRGHLYVAVFTSDPVTDRDGAVNVANARIDDVDMSGADARVPYEVQGIPPRSEPYYVTAFLDDNGTVDPSSPASAGPDRGDLVALDGFSSVSVTIADETPVALDLDLNLNLPF